MELRDEDLGLAASRMLGAKQLKRPTYLYLCCFYLGGFLITSIQYNISQNPILVIKAPTLIMLRLSG